MTTLGWRSQARRIAQRLPCGSALLAALLMPVMLVSVSARAAAAPRVYVEEFTWTELRDRVAAGATTVLVPIGGTEQSGPHMALGKHNVRARVLAGRIAEQLGNAVVAPVIAYVPEGSIAPPAGHMKFPGTISIGETTFEALLEDTGRSLRQHGFRDIVFIGDHGGYQKNEVRAAAVLNREWSARPTARAWALVDYYRVSQDEYVAWLKSRGFGAEEIGTHAGLADTSLMLAVDPTLVRRDAIVAHAKPGPLDGVHGDPRRASAELGKPGIELIVNTSVARIRAMTGSR